jgi:membrane associated rhomboid family serine protease
MNWAIIALNVAVLVYEMRLPAEELDALVMGYGAVPARVLAGPGAGRYLPLVTSTFLHGGWWHLLSNMWALLIFGDNIEDRLGSMRYLLFYVAVGALAGLVHVYLNATSTLPVVGASGAVAGVMGAYLVTYPRARVITLIPLGFLWFTAVPAVVYLLIWFGIQLFSGVRTLSAGGLDLTGRVAWWAHVGGFCTGMVLIKFLTVRRSYAAWRAGG